MKYLCLIVLLLCRSYALADSVPSLQAAPELDHLVNDHLARRLQSNALHAAKAAFQIRLEDAVHSDEYYLAYRTYGDALIAAGAFTQAAEAYRDGASLKVLKPQDKVNLLVALARIGLADRDFLRWATRSMIRANKIAALNKLEVPDLLDLKFADLLMVSGDVAAARKLYLALWQARPQQRQAWFGEPTVLLSRLGGVEDVANQAADDTLQSAYSEVMLSKEHQQIYDWQGYKVYRPVIRGGQLEFFESSGVEAQPAT